MSIYKSPEGIYIGGEHNDLIGKYCSDIFMSLHTIQQEQDNISSNIETLETFSHKIFLEKSNALYKTLSIHRTTVSEMTIGDLSETKELTSMRDTILKHIDTNIERLSTITSLHILYAIEEEVTSISKHIDMLSKQNDLSALLQEAGSYEQFKKTFINRLDFLQQSLSKVQDTNTDNGGISLNKKSISKEKVEEKIILTKRKSSLIYKKLFLASASGRKKSNTNYDDIFKGTPFEGFKPPFGGK